VIKKQNSDLMIDNCALISQRKFHVKSNHVMNKESYKLPFSNFSNLVWLAVYQSSSDDTFDKGLMGVGGFFVISFTLSSTIFTIAGSNGVFSMGSKSFPSRPPQVSVKVAIIELDL